MNKAFIINKLIDKNGIAITNGKKIFMMVVKKKISNNIKQKGYEEKPWEDNTFKCNHHIKTLTITIQRFFISLTKLDTYLIFK